MVTLGTFRVTGGKMIVTDPCYDRGTWCQGNLKNVRNGEWVAGIDTHDFGSGGLGGKRVTRLRAKHISVSAGAAWTVEDVDIGVDSGQCGIFSLSKYPEADSQDSKFYDTCCNLTLSPNRGGIVDDFGTVSSSGWGDGGYVLRTRRDSTKKVVEVEVIFIDEDEEDQKKCVQCGELSSELDDAGYCDTCQPQDDNDDTEEV